MWDDDELIEVIHASPAVVDDALRAIQQDGGAAPIDLDAFTAAAGVLGTDPARLCVDQLRARGLLAAFQAALLARGIPAPAVDGNGRGTAVTRGGGGADHDGDAHGEDDEDDESSAAGRSDFDALRRFLGRAQTFRCRVEVEHAFSGSGCLVGPGLVLTAWHVVSTTEPGVEPAVAPHVSVVLSDGSAHEAHMPPAYASPCGDAEWDDQAPRSDAEVVNRHDVALLALETPAARHLGYVPLPDAAPAVAARSRVYLLDFPHGDDGQLADGTTWKIRNVTSRLYHDVATESGSSGGAFFDRSFRLLGLHQGGIRSTRSGREVKRGRLVPLRLFYDALAGLVADDIAPAEIWRLDGDRTQLVVGRDLFVSAVAAAAEENGPVRGIRVKRRRPAEADEAGLGFSYRILVELLLRRGAAHVPVALPLDEPVADLVGDLRRRVESAGIALTAPGLDEAPPAGTTLETSARERAHRLAAAVDEAAAATGRTVWFFVDNPSVPLSESARLELEAFVAESLALPGIRLVIAGLETVPLAGLEFSSPAAADPTGPHGLVVDYVGGFSREDLLDCLTRASQDLTGDVDSDRIAFVVDMLLGELDDFNGEFRDADLERVVTGLQPFLEYLRAQGGGGP
ncbi:V8-like Glu-specific endopeptidase [Agromyces flavus]|uniref:Serine protease n=1 Tax=Agromyces flavus TaxID=589382 RepID=A0A1H1YQ18_9MICO|nr:serine protease [Agromyces flavus]MCP2366766.1 V8-like Glu-specific endopeptidase [Agromyces flavus]GGI45327.1 trypsin-like peptidase domain family protein [Agromyces flavus]SDT23450.1 V8-like Glu-specific endopeptidase [Agromyces flavus]